MTRGRSLHYVISPGRGSCSIVCGGALLGAASTSAPLVSSSAEYDALADTQNPQLDQRSTDGRNTERSIEGRETFNIYVHKFLVFTSDSRVCSEQPVSVNL